MENLKGRLSGLDIVNVSDTPTNIKIMAKSSVAVDSCVYCSSSEIDKHGISQVRLVDAPINDKKVFVIVDKHRFKCASCKKTFFEPILCQYEPLRMTQYAALNIKQKVLRHSLSSISQLFGVDRSTIRRVVAQM